MTSRPPLPLALLAIALLVGGQACDRRFAFDVESGGAGAGGVSGAGANAASGAQVGGAASGSASGGTSGAEASTAGAGYAGSEATCGSLDACALGLHCANDRCVQCASDLDCAAYALPRCEPTRHRCVACVSTADCPDGFACDSLANRCLQTCRTEADCPKDAHGCDERRQVCYECDEDRECATSALGPLCASDGSGCVQCRKDADCSDQYCDQLSGRCVQCRDANDCASLLCDPTTFTCAVP